MRDLRGCWPAVVSGRRALRDRLIQAYGDSARGYHDLRHLAEVLDRLDVLLAQEADPAVHRTALVLAAWFHDAVYGTPGGDSSAYDAAGGDEERSARLAERELAAAGAPPPLVAEVARLVRLTTSHRADEDDRLGRLLCDADLSILAADQLRYQEYVDGVRREYATVPAEDFRAGRVELVRTLLERPHLYHTRFARDHWEAAARRNLRRELAALEAAEPSGTPA